MTHRLLALTALLAAALPALAQELDPLQFPEGVPAVAPAPAIPPVRPVRPVTRVTGESPTRPVYPVPPAARVRGATPVRPVTGASGTAPEQIPANVRRVMAAYQSYLSAVHAPNPDVREIARRLQAYHQVLREVFGEEAAQVASGVQTSDVGPPTVGDEDGTFPDTPPDDNAAVVPGQTRRIVFLRESPRSYTLYVGEGGQAEAKAHVAKAPLAGWGWDWRENVKASADDHQNNRGWMGRRKNTGYWHLVKTDARTGANTDVMVLRPRGRGYDVYNQAQQLFAKVRWETRQEDGQAVPQRVYYYHQGNTDSPVASVIQAQVDGEPALVLRDGAGQGSSPKVVMVFQGWTAAPGAGGAQGGLSFGGLFGGGGSGGGGGVAAASADERRASGVFVDGWVVDATVDAVGWRDTVGVMGNFQFH